MATNPDPDRTNDAERQRPVVLFIEDNLTQLDLYSMMIEGELSVVKATRGETGYQLALSEQPDVIVLDVLLPDVDGLALADRIRANAATASIPIVVLTADDAARERAEAHGDFSDVLLKPCPADRLMTAIRRSLSD
jgi:CheY-like chemotaxis protein